jgi:hypothetical protein
MRRNVALVTVCAAALLVVNSGIALAHTVSFPTDISAERSPDGVVAPGTEVHISGELTSDKRACSKGSEIRLIEVGQGTIDTDMTGHRGRFSFDVTVQDTTRYRVKFPGKILNSVHPHSHVCEASTTSLRVRVG